MEMDLAHQDEPSSHGYRNDSRVDLNLRLQGGEHPGDAQWIGLYFQGFPSATHPV
jgi:hypothetical protein